MEFWKICRAINNPIRFAPLREIMLALFFFYVGCQALRKEGTIPAEYLSRVCLHDGDFVVTLDKGRPNRGKPVFVLWYNGWKIEDVVEGTSYKDLGRYVFVLTVVRDKKGSEIMRWVQSDNGDISPRRMLRAHLMSKASGHISSSDPFETDYISISKKGDKWGEDIFTLTDGCVSVYSQRLKRQIEFRFTLRD